MKRISVIVLAMFLSTFSWVTLAGERDSCARTAGACERAPSVADGNYGVRKPAVASDVISSALALAIHAVWPKSENTSTRNSLTDPSEGPLGNAQFGVDANRESAGVRLTWSF